MMKRWNFAAQIAAMAACTLFGGCAGRQWMNNNQQAAAQQPVPQENQAAAAPAPYALTAQCNGPMVRFKLQNLGDSDLQVQEKDFALVVPGHGRKVIPYSMESVSVDLPSRVVRPNESVEGRAVFTDNNMPQGCRLVFKPYSRPSDQGTYAQIVSPSSATM